MRAGSLVDHFTNQFQEFIILVIKMYKFFVLLGSGVHLEALPLSIE